MRSDIKTHRDARLECFRFVKLTIRREYSCKVTLKNKFLQISTLRFNVYYIGKEPVSGVNQTMR